MPFFKELFLNIFNSWHVSFNALCNSAFVEITSRSFLISDFESFCPVIFTPSAGLHHVPAALQLQGSSRRPLLNLTERRLALLVAQSHCRIFFYLSVLKSHRTARLWSRILRLTIASLTLQAYSTYLFLTLW